MKPKLGFETASNKPKATNGRLDFQVFGFLKRSFSMQTSMKRGEPPELDSGRRSPG